MPQKIENDTKHSRIGASSAERWWNCPGSINLIATLPAKPPPGVWAAEGTLAHWLGEQMLQGGNNVYEEVGNEYEVDGHTFEVSDEMAECVEIYYNVIHDQLSMYGLSDRDLAIETSVNLHHIDKEAFGTCDALIEVPMYKLIVVDYKHGKGAVDVVDNKQLLYYGLGAYYSLTEDERNDVVEIEGIIVQPRSRGSDMEDGWASHSYSREEFLAFEGELTEAIRRTRQADAPLAAGDHCKFCPAKPICPAIRENMQARAKLVFSAVETEPLDLPKPSTLSPERLSTLLQNAESLKEWASSVVEYASFLAKKGKKIPGYKLVEKIGNRKWTNPDKVPEIFGAYGDDIYNKKLKSPAQMADLRYQTDKKAGFKSTKKEVENTINQYCHRPVTGETLVPEEDERKGVKKKTLKEVFQNEL